MILNPNDFCGLSEDTVHSISADINSLVINLYNQAADIWDTIAANDSQFFTECHYDITVLSCSYQFSKLLTFHDKTTHDAIAFVAMGKNDYGETLFAWAENNGKCLPDIITESVNRKIPFSNIKVSHCIALRKSMDRIWIPISNTNSYDLRAQLTAKILKTESSCLDD